MHRTWPPVSKHFAVLHQENSLESWLSKFRPLLQPLPGHAIPIPPAPWFQPSRVLQEPVQLTNLTKNKQNPEASPPCLIFCWISELNQVPRS